MSTRPPLYLVDGSGYIFRAYYAIAPLSNSKGLPTNALFGFTRMLLKLLRDIQAKNIVVAFDTGEPTFRHKLYEDYKANRDECPEDLVPQMPHFRKIVESLGIVHFEKPGVEADDIIATLTKRFASPEQPIVIVSGDKDLTQLVTEDVQMWDAMRDIRYDPKKVFEKFGVKPEQILDYLSLIGDSSDNIPGVRGIGPKTAQRLIGEFSSLEELLEDSEKIGALEGLRGAAGIQKKIESGVEMLRLSQELITLDTEVEPFLGIESIEKLSWTPPEHALVQALFDEFEFTGMQKFLDGLPGVSSSQEEKQTAFQKTFHTVTRETFHSFVELLRAQPVFAFDTETSSLDYLDCVLIGISFSWDENEAYYLPLASDKEPEKVLNSNEVCSVLTPIFANPEIKKVGLHLKYDMNVLAEAGYEVNGVFFDALLASYVLHPDKRQHGLKALAWSLLGEQMTTFEEVVGDREHIGQVEIEKVSAYAGNDAAVSWALWKQLEEELGACELSLGSGVDDSKVSPRHVFEKVEIPLVSVLSQMERAGVKLDTDFLKSLGEELEKDIAQLELDIHALAGQEFNVNSPKQLSSILFEHLGIPTTGIKKTQTAYSTDASVLQRLAPKYEIVSKLMEYRELHKLKTTYVDALQRLVHPKTGRVHSSFNQAIAATGRLSSSEPNLQNIPIRGERGRQIRKAFIAEKGNLLVSADYSQIELRVLAHLSQDKNLQEAFRSGEDIHAATARELFGPLASGEEFNKLRRAAKTINFGIIYGMGAFRLARELDISRKQAQQYIDDYFAKYPNVARYFDELKERAEGGGYVETLFGRRRYLSEIDAAGRDTGYLLRSIMNFPVQGSAAEIIKIAMIGLEQRLLPLGEEARMVLQVHDELVVEFREERREEIENLVRDKMEKAVSLTVPLQVDTRISRSWGEGK